MNRLQAYYEQLKLPIKGIFFGCFFVALGSILTNPYLTTIFRLDGDFTVAVANVLLYGGGIILTYFPALVFVKLLPHRINEPNIVVTGLISYIIFQVILMLLGPQALPAPAYISYIHITAGETLHEIFKTGIFGMGAIFLWVRYIYRRRNMTSALNESYHDTDSSRFLRSILGAAVIGVIFTFIWPFFINSLYEFMNFVASDSSNPMSLFAYGFVDRLLALGNVQSILHQEMWFGELGGSWLNASEQTFIGDVNIWNAQLKDPAVQLGIGGAGRYTSAYYILNLFAIPGYLLSVQTLYTNKRVKRLNIAFFIGAIVLSWVSGILLPIEIVMLLTSPILYTFHLFSTGFIFAVLSGLEVNLGFLYAGNAFVSPGNIIDLFSYVTNPNIFPRLSSSIMILILLGILVFLVYFIVTRLYFSKVALDPLNVINKKEYIGDFIERLGNLENIEKVHNTPTHLYVRLYDRDQLNSEGLHLQGVVRIVETRHGFILSLGSSAFMVQKTINKQLKQYQKEQELEKEES